MDIKAANRGCATSKEFNVMTLIVSEYATITPVYLKICALAHKDRTGPICALAQPRYQVCYQLGFLESSNKSTKEGRLLDRGWRINHCL